MKKSISVLIIIIVTIFSCKKTSNQVQDSKNVESQSQLSGIPLCPEGTHAVLTKEFDEFHFHRPKKECKSGFWFCTIGGKWVTRCVPNNSHAYIAGTTAYLSARVLDDGKVEIHFPLVVDVI